MKAITVQQPWAWAIIHGGKTVENRSTLWKYRGPLAIHAGQRWSERGGAVLADRAAHRQLTGLPPIGRLGYAYGAIIGVVDLVAAHWAHPHCCDGNPWAEHSYVEHGGMKTIATVAHYELANARPVTPIDCKGRLGLWNVPDDIERLLAA